MSNVNHDTEKAILAAAEREFMLKGFGGARTTAIAQRAGVTHAMLHYYFRTKESLYDRIIEEKAAELLDQLLSLFNQEEGRTFMHKVCHVAMRHFDMLVENPLLPGFVLNEFRNNPERLEGWFTKISSVVATLGPRLQEELEVAHMEGSICHISVPQLLTDIILLNISSVSFADVLCRIYGMTREEYLTMRRKENIEVIRKRLLP